MTMQEIRPGIVIILLVIIIVLAITCASIFGDLGKGEAVSLQDDKKYEFLDAHQTILKINSISQEDDLKNFSCLFQDENDMKTNEAKRSNFKLFVGEAPTVLEQNFTLNVIDPPVIRFEPEPAIFQLGSRQGQIKCSIHGLPTKKEKQKVSWFKNRYRIQTNSKYSVDSSTGRLIVNQITMNDAGMYTCKVVAGQTFARGKVYVSVIDDFATRCKNKASYAYCKLVAMRGMCHKFANVCCRTCQKYLQP